MCRFYLHKHFVLLRRAVVSVAMLGVFVGCEKPASDQKEMPLDRPTAEIEMTLSAAVGVDDIYNRPEEYAILNLSIFVADAGGETFTDKFVYQAFTADPSSGTAGCQKVSFPTTFQPTGNKDIYVIANHNNAASLNALNTVSDLRGLRTPQLSQGHLIPFERGLPMYGESLDVAFSESEPMHIQLIRTCAKIDFTLSFPDPTWIGTNNRASLLSAQSDTYYVFSEAAIPAADLVQYPEITLRPQPDPSLFTAIIYIYESRHYLSYISLKTVVNGKNKEYVIDSDVPLPVRNHMYSVVMEILHPITGPDAKASTRITIREGDRLLMIQ
jgi:hypothetical protein